MAPLRVEGTLKQWTAAHRTLLNGARLGFNPIHAPEVVAELAALASSMTAVREGAEEILHSGAVASGGAMPLAATLARLLAAEEAFCGHGKNRGPDRVHGAASDSSLAPGTIVITGLALGIMASAFWGVFQPAAKIIRQQQIRLSEGEARHRQFTLLLAEAHNELEERSCNARFSCVMPTGACKAKSPSAKPSPSTTAGIICGSGASNTSTARSAALLNSLGPFRLHRPACRETGFWAGPERPRPAVVFQQVAIQKSPGRVLSATRIDSADG